MNSLLDIMWGGTIHELKYEFDNNRRLTMHEQNFQQKKICKKL